MAGASPGGSERRGATRRHGGRTYYPTAAAPFLDQNLSEISDIEGRCCVLTRPWRLRGATKTSDGALLEARREAARPERSEGRAARGRLPSLSTELPDIRFKPRFVSVGSAPASGWRSAAPAPRPVVRSAALRYSVGSSGGCSALQPAKSVIWQRNDAPAAPARQIQAILDVHPAARQDGEPETPVRVNPRTRLAPHPACPWWSSRF
jgi:hypothetical protein